MKVYCMNCGQWYDIAESHDGDVKCEKCGIELFVEKKYSDNHNLMKVADSKKTSGLAIQVISTSLFILSALSLLLGIFVGYRISEIHGQGLGIAIFIGCVVSAIVYLALGTILRIVDDNSMRLKRIEGLLSKKK